MVDDVGRTDPPQLGTEAATLLGFLDFHRQTLRWKTSGLDAAQLGTSLAPSTMTLGGLLKHLALVESSWFSRILLGQGHRPPFDTVDWENDPDWDWHSASGDSPEQLRALYDAAIAESDRTVAEALASPTGLDTQSVVTGRRTGEPFSLRWILVHLIEEYARHNGHADLLRESIDGLTGE